MPIYSFKCDDCGEVHEKLMKFSEAPPPCPVCASLKQAKQLSTGTGFCLMGRGWTRPGMKASGGDR